MEMERNPVVPASSEVALHDARCKALADARLAQAMLAHAIEALSQGEVVDFSALALIVSSTLDETVETLTSEVRRHGHDAIYADLRDQVRNLIGEP